MSDERSRITPSELEAALRAVDPSVVLVEPRILRRVIKSLYPRLGGFMRLPHSKGFGIERSRLLELVERNELGEPAWSATTPHVLLLEKPAAYALSGTERAERLTYFWRILFHLRAHLEVEQRLGTGAAGAKRVSDRLQGIGLVEFEEIRTVLRDDRYLLDPENDRAVYVEFAVVHRELGYFAPFLLQHYFPGASRRPHLEEVIAADLDAESLFQATRPAGALDPRQALLLTSESENGSVRAVASAAAGSSRQDCLERAAQAMARGNLVRAALLRASVAGAEQEVQSDLDRLAKRLRNALHLAAPEAQAWRDQLPALLETAGGDSWSVRTRLLYDLQSVCVDHERGVYAIDLVEWALSFGRRPIRRPLPGQDEVLGLKHLRSALARLPDAGLDNARRRALAQLLAGAIHHGEERLRALFRPVLRNVAHEVGFRPANVTETIALDKLVEELLDRIAERGFITIGDLRDAISRNQLKLVDLTGAGEFFGGDRLLQSDSRLTEALDGIYRGGEIYMRWLQRFSALAFGTRVGRFLTRNLALPFGSAFFILEGLPHIVGPIVNLFREPVVTAIEPDVVAGIEPDVVAVAEGEAASAGVDLEDWLDVPSPAEVKAEIHLLNAYSFLGLGFFLLALLQIPAFRAWVGRSLLSFFHGAHWLLLDIPAALIQWAPLQFVLHSRPFLLFKRWILKPAALAALPSLVLPLVGAGPKVWGAGAGTIFVMAAVLLNSRLGRDVEEAFDDWLARRWRQLRIDILPGLFWLVIELFKTLLELMERLLYAVDEWLRFRTGDNRLAMFVKPVLGVFWFVLTYFIRIFVNLFVEPTFNPIKHFPVVTVVAKLMFTMIKQLGPIVTTPLEQVMGRAIAVPVAGLIFFFLPGLAGFLVWELKENWRLYRANRPRDLKQVSIGHHGETMVRLLRRGIHSGTLPKLYAKLRKASRRALRGGNWRPFRKLQNSFAQVEESLRHFVDREFIALLRLSKQWDTLSVHVTEIVLETKRIRIMLQGADPQARPAEIAFVVQGPWLVARVAEVGWWAGLTAVQRETLAVALAGLYKFAGVDLIDERIEVQLKTDRSFFNIKDENLVWRPNPGSEETVTYDLNEQPLLLPHATNASGSWPALLPDNLFFSQQPLAWDEWIDRWERDASSTIPPAHFAQGLVPEHRPTAT